MKYKIYIIRQAEYESTQRYRFTSIVQSVILDDQFEDMEFDTIEEAYTSIIEQGSQYCNYTILPYIYRTN